MLQLAQVLRHVVQFLRVVGPGVVGDRVGGFVAVGGGGQVGEVGRGAGEGGGAGEEVAGEGAGVVCKRRAGGGESAMDLLTSGVFISGGRCVREVGGLGIP